MLDATDLGALTSELAAAYRGAPAIITDRRVIGFDELDELAGRFAAGLVARGVQPGDRVAILAENSPEWLVTYFGIAKAGAVMVALNTWSTAAELARAIRHAEPTVIVASASFLGRRYADEVAALLDEGTTLLTIGTAPPGESWTDALDDRPLARSRATADGDAVILYTSGSTGAPKGVVLDHYGLVVNNIAVGERYGFEPADRVLLVVPLCFAMGCVQITLSALMRGAALVVRPRFDPDDAIAAIARHGCTAFFGFGHMAHALVEAASFAPPLIATLEKGRCGHSASDIAFAFERLGMSRVCNAYGMTELYGVAAMTAHSDAPALQLEGRLRALPGVDLRIVDARTGRALPVGSAGEVRVKAHRGPRGYFRDERAAAAAFDENGYFRTGDVGMLHDDGRFSYLGRSKLMIKTGGMLVSPLAVEEVLEQHPSVAKAFVSGMPDDRLEERIVAAIYPDGPLDLDELRAWAKAHVRSYEVPHHFVRIDEIPSLGTQKVDRASIARFAEAVLSGDE